MEIETPPNGAMIQIKLFSQNVDDDHFHAAFSCGSRGNSGRLRVGHVMFNNGDVPAYRTALRWRYAPETEWRK